MPAQSVGNLYEMRIENTKRDDFFNFYASISSEYNYRYECVPLKDALKRYFDECYRFLFLAHFLKGTMGHAAHIVLERLNYCFTDWMMS